MFSFKGVISLYQEVLSNSDLDPHAEQKNTMKGALEAVNSSLGIYM